MLTAQATMNSREDVGRAIPGANDDAQEFEKLRERLLHQQPQSKALLERLRARLGRKTKQRAFARLDGNRCSACNMTVASAQIQKIKAGEFINCAHCSIFLYKQHW